jgi:hypothetical protein
MRHLLSWLFLTTVALGATARADDSLAGQFRVLDVDFKRGLVLVEEQSPDSWQGDGGSRCRNTFLGGRGLALVVLDMAGAAPRRFVLAGFPEKGRCPTQKSVEQARADATARLATLGLTPGAPMAMRAFDGAADLSVVEQRIERMDDEAGQDHVIHRTLRRGEASVFATTLTYPQFNILQYTVDSWWLEKDGQAAIVHRTVSRTMRTIDITFAADGPLSPVPGVDVGGLTTVAMSLPEGCAVSVVAPAGRLQRTVAVTVRDALRGRGKAEVGPVKAARAPRPTTTVYSAPACESGAKAIAALLPGGADTAPLTWEARGGIVVAIGDSIASVAATGQVTPPTP